MGWLGGLFGRGKPPEQRRAEAMNKKAMNLILRGKLVEAEEMLQTALKVAPNMAALHHNLGAVYLNQKKFDAALKEMRRAVHLDPGDVESRIAIAKAYADMGKPDKALAEYRQICTDAPWDWRSQISLGNALLERGDLDQALEHLEKGVELRPKEELAHLILAVALERKGDLEKASKEYRAVRDLTRTGQNRTAASEKMKELQKRQKSEAT